MHAFAEGPRSLLPDPALPDLGGFSVEAQSHGGSPMWVSPLHSGRSAAGFSHHKGKTECFFYQPSWMYCVCPISFYLTHTCTYTYIFRYPVTAHIFFMKFHWGINCMLWYSVHFNKDPPHVPNNSNIIILSIRRTKTFFSAVVLASKSSIAKAHESFGGCMMGRKQ